MMSQKFCDILVWAFLQRGYMLFWTNPENNIPQNSSFTATYFPSHKLSK